MKTSATAVRMRSPWAARNVKRLAAFVAAVALGGVLVAVQATPAVADNGDGLMGCNSGEICFKKNWDGYWNRDIKHFWYGADHGSYSWCACIGGSGGNVQYNTSMYWNRDTQCDVYIVDSAGTTMKMARNGQSNYTWIGYLWNDADFGHQRCSPLLPFGQ